VFGLDESIAALGRGHSLAFGLVVALLLGLRHATDPDHLSALTTLAAGDRAGPKAGSVLGLSWGVGHGLSLTAFGLPVVLVHDRLPTPLYEVAEVGVGVTIMALAVRLWLRWRRGRFHFHSHEHPGGLEHAHVHSHEAGEAHEHGHGPRTPLGAFAIGLIHGAGGSGGMTVLLLAATPSATSASVSLAVVALGAALSMWAFSTGLGLAFVSRPARRRFHSVAPLLACASFLFGAWYSVAGLTLL